MLFTKTMRVMKLTAFLLLIGALQVHARAFSQKITLTTKDIPLEKLFRELERQSGYQFFFAESDLRHAKPVSLTATDEDLIRVLDTCLKDQPLTYSILKRTVVILLKEDVKKKETALTAGEEQRSGPPLEIKGRVVNEKGEPVLANIVVKGSVKMSNSNGNFSYSAKVTSTNSDGYFTMPGVGENDTLVVTAVNIEPIEIKVAGRTYLLITAKTKVAEGEDVQVIVSNGYQKISKERSAGSFSIADMGTVANRSSSMNVLQRLDGLIPGLVVNNSPSAARDGNPFLIRGLTTINASRNPLIVVDGMAVDVSNVSSINPQDIASVVVLKDATAASIWGARASNGVVVIVTKKGRTGEKLKVDYDGFINFQGKPDIGYFPVLNSPQYIQASKETFDPVDYPYNTSTAYNSAYGNHTGLSPDRQILYDVNRGVLTQGQGDAKLDSLSNISNASQIKNVWYRPASLMNHTISLSGGSDKYAVYGSFAYTNTRDYTPGDRNNMYKINVRQDFNFSRYLKVYLITDLSNTTTSSNRSIAIDDRFLPYQLFRDPAGNSISMPYMGHVSEEQRPAIEALSGIGLNYDPLDNVTTGFTKSYAFLGRFNGGVTVNLLKGLRFEGLYGYIRGANRTQQYDDHTNYQQRINVLNFAVADPGGTVTYNLPATGGMYTVSNATLENWVVRDQLVYDHGWKNDLHQLTALFGQEAQEQRTVVNNSTVYGYDLETETYATLDYKTLTSAGIATPILAQSPTGSILSGNTFFGESESVPRSRFTSYYANAAYTFDRKYTVNGSWRNDQSNLFGLNRSAQRKPVWSVGLKWLLSGETLMEGAKQVDHLALRVTYGITGISPSPGSASSYDVLAPVALPYAPGGQGFSISTAANPSLTWESTKTYNLGVDFGLFNNRITGSADFYKKETSNLLGNLNVNPITGFNAIYGNVGSLSNKGAEVIINTVNIRKRDFGWTTSATLSYNKNKISSLGFLNAPVTGDYQVLHNVYMAGDPAFSVFAYNYAGLDSLGDPRIKAAGKTTKVIGAAQPGDVLNMGVYQPVWSGGLSNLFNYKSFALSVNIVYNLGSVMFRDANTVYTYNNGPGGFIQNQDFQAGNLNAEFAGRWKQPGDEARTNIPSFVGNAATDGQRRNTNYYIYGNLNVVSASYAKIRDITLSYAVPPSVVKKMNAERLVFRVQLSNLMLWKANHYGIDPEFQDARYGIRSMPFNQKTITIGAHLTL